MLRNVNFIGAVVVLAILLTITQMGDQKCDASFEVAHAEQGQNDHGDAGDSHELYDDQESNESH
jgi:hypothetical protein